ncbi:hypothetical protein AGMMS49960_22110 [Betaproteobacteria bacterium]|nr:hypothetical protein AGMMS49960_22110 [Betaproteobacteria bacterium]
MINCSNILKKFFSLIASDKFLEMSRINPESFTRNTNMNFIDIIYFMLSRGKDNTSVELDRYAQNEGIKPVSRQAYCKSRQNIKSSAFKYLNKWLVNKIYSSQDYKTHKNYLVLAIDGCLLDMPWVDELKTEYGGKSNKNGEIEAIKARSSGLYDCDNKIMIDFEVAPYKVSEKELTLKNIQNSLEIIKDKNPLTIFDRYYASLELFNYLSNLEFKFLIRLKKNFYKET